LTGSSGRRRVEHYCASPLWNWGEIFPEPVEADYDEEDPNYRVPACEYFTPVDWRVPVRVHRDEVWRVRGKWHCLNCLYHVEVEIHEDVGRPHG